MSKGRGATTNRTSNRFGLPQREMDDEWLNSAADIDGPPPKLRTTTTILKPRTIISYNDSPDIPFDRSVNPINGCEHGCIYCFARPSHTYHDLSPGLDFESKLFIKPDAPALLRAEFARRSYRPRILAMGTNTDPYQPIEAHWRITRAILELCLATRHPVSITTKSDRILRDLDLLAELAALDLVVAMLSITTLDPRLATRMEPRAAAPHRRLHAVRQLAAAGVPVVVSAAPMIPALNDHEVEDIARTAAQAGASRLEWIPVRLPYEVAPMFEAWLAEHYPDRKNRILNGIRTMRNGRLNDPDLRSRFRADGAWGAMMAARIATARRRHQLNGPWPAPRTDLFEKPSPDPRQGSLFQASARSPTNGLF